MKILYIGPVKDFSGYSVAARGYVQALDQAGADITVRAVKYDQADPGSSYECTQRERDLLKKPLEDIDVVIQHTTPNECRPVKGKVDIAVVAWETTRIPQYWVDKLNKFDAVITFCDASVNAFKDCGVTVPIHKIPHTFDIPNYSLDGIEVISAPSDPGILKDKFIFYNISQFSTKKGIDVLLRAYYGAFHGKGDEVMLMLKTYVNMGAREREDKKLVEYLESVKTAMRLPMEGYPKVMLITKTLSDEYIKKLHATGDAYVSSSRAEGWNIPYFEALAYGNRGIGTRWGGQAEFVTDQDVVNDIVFPVEYRMDPLVGQIHGDPELYTSFDLIADPSVSSMMEQMKKVYNLRDIPVQKIDLNCFDHSVVGPQMLNIISDITSATLMTVY